MLKEILLCGACIAALMFLLMSSQPESAPDPITPSAIGGSEPARMVIDMEMRRERLDELGEVEPSPQPIQPARRVRWSPRVDSPIALLEPREAAKYEPTEASLREFVSTVPELAGVDVQWSDELAEIWLLCQEHRALRAFVVSYERRVYDSWKRYRDAEALAAELAPTTRYIESHVDSTEDTWLAWSLINRYTEEVRQKIIEEGEEAPMRDSVATRWDLNAKLVQAQSPAFEALEAILKGKQ